MSEFKTFKNLLMAVMSEHGMLVKVDEVSHNLIIQPLTKDGLMNIISSYRVHLDEIVVKELDLVHFIGSRREFQIYPLSLTEYDDEFWHFNNGFTGVDDTVRTSFVRVMKANKISFALDNGKLLSPSEFVMYTPDRVVLWFYTLALTLAIQETMDQLWNHGIGEVYLETVLHLSTLLEITGLSFAIFAENIASLKGLSKACGDWAVKSNRLALEQLRSLNTKLAKTIRSPYDVCARVTNKVIPNTEENLRRVVVLVKNSLMYYRTYGQIALVMLSLEFGVVFPRLDTPADAITARIPILSALGRLEHSLFIKAKDDLAVEALNAYASSN